MHRGTEPELPGSTHNKISKLARLLATAELQPFAMKWTKKVLPQHAMALQQKPMMPEDFPPPPNEGISLRGTL